VNQYLTDIYWKLAAVRGMDRVCDVAFVSHLSIISHRASSESDKSTARLIMQSKLHSFSREFSFTLSWLILLMKKKKREKKRNVEKSSEVNLQSGRTFFCSQFLL
jgi:hypothetical protein